MPAPYVRRKPTHAFRRQRALVTGQLARFMTPTLIAKSGDCQAPARAYKAFAVATAQASARSLAEPHRGPSSQHATTRPPRQTSSLQKRSLIPTLAAASRSLPIICSSPNRCLKPDLLLHGQAPVRAVPNIRGASAGQPALRCKVHLMPRRSGSVAHPTDDITARSFW